jgi:DNA (cytosine-5)-methyltransferase 1
MVCSTKTLIEKRTLRAVDLFCGCGGLTEGLKEAGFQVIAALDIESLAVETYKMNHPEVIVLERDICSVSVEEFLAVSRLKVGELDLLAGCPPCQGFSSMRTLNGSRCIDDPRNNLLLEFQRFVEGLRPKVVMLENVPGLIKDKRFENFLQRMKELGYKGNPEVLNAAEYGVPQRRRRLICVLSLTGDVSPAPKVKVKKTVRDAIGSLPLPGQSGDPLHDIIEKRDPKVIEIIKAIPKDGGSRLDLPVEYHLQCHIKCNGFKDVYGRMKWGDVSPTITGGCVNPSKGRFLHPEQDRAITLREAALLQSFPSGYRFSLRRGKFPAALLIGNALPPEFIRRHAQIAYNHLENGSK